MNYTEWKEAFLEMLRNDWKDSLSNMSFDNWCQSVWDKRMAELEIEAWEINNAT